MAATIRQRDASHVSQFTCFAVIGGFATVCQYALLFTLVDLLEVEPVLAAVIAYLCGAAITFSLNLRITFRGRARSLHRAAGRYLLVNLVGLGINTLIFRALLESGWYYLAAQAIATIVVLFYNFAGSRFFAFH